MSPTIEQTQALSQRLRDVVKLVDSLHQDVLATVNEVALDKPSTSRAYVRSVFGYIEGALSGMCTYLIEGQDILEWTLTEPETKVLWDAVLNPSVLRPDGGRATLNERTKQTFKIGRRLFGGHCAANFGGVDYRAFRDAIIIRDRLMHPKKSTDMDISQNDLAIVDKGRDWFRKSALSFFESAVTHFQGQMAKRGHRTRRYT